MSNEALTWAYRQVTGSTCRKAVLVALADKADENHSCYPSQAALAKLTEQSVRSVRKALVELERLGLVTRRHRAKANGSRNSDRYVLAVSVVVGVPAYRQDVPPAPRAARPPDVSDNAPESGAEPRSSTSPDQPANPARPTGTTCRQTHREQPSENKDRARQRPPTRGTRLPPDWRPTPADIDWQRQQGIPDDLAREWHQDFTAYWWSKAGAGATKLNWSLTWQTWMRRNWREHPASGGNVHRLRTAPARRDDVPEAMW